MSKKNKQQKYQTDALKKWLLFATVVAFFFSLIVLKERNPKNTQHNVDLYLRLVEIRLTYIELYELNPTSSDFSDRFAQTITNLQEQHTETQTYIEQNRNKLSDHSTKALDIITRQIELIAQVDNNFSAFGVLFSPMYQTVPQEQVAYLTREEIRENVLTLSQDIHSVSSYINENSDYTAMRESISEIMLLIDHITLELDNDTGELPVDSLSALLETVNTLQVEAHTYIKQEFETDEAVQMLVDLTNLIQELHTEITTTVE